MKEQPLKISPVITNLVLLAVAIVVTGATFFEDDGQAYLFPKVVVAVMLITTVADFFISQFKGTGEIKINRRAIRNFMPGFIASIVLVTVAETVGFYMVCFGFMLLTVYMYSAQIRNAIAQKSAWLPAVIKDGLFAMGFVIVVYLLFSVLLQVQTPRGWIL